MDQIDIPLDQFLSEVRARNTAEDGSLKDPRLELRMQNEICVGCHKRYREKYPGQAFQVECQGIYEEEDYKIYQDRMKASGEEVPLDDIRELLDVEFWAERNAVMKDENGDINPYRVGKWKHQRKALRCTASRIVNRWGRGMGKSSVAIIKMLHRVSIHKRYESLCLCPGGAQTQKWLQEIDFQLEHSKTLKTSCAAKKQQPYILYRLFNGSLESIFTAGSKSGKGADNVRSQSPRHVDLEEQDLLTRADYKAVMPLLRRYKNSTFEGYSTPTGKREDFWEMCVRSPEYQEFHIPITEHPDWSPKMQAACMKESRTSDRYLHEWMAEFGDPEAGVFKKYFIEKAQRHYTYASLMWDSSHKQVVDIAWNDCPYDPAKSYFLGVDWNGQGTGTRIRVVEYDKATHRIRVVLTETIDTPRTTTQDSLQAIVRLNRYFHCEDVYIDYGFGNAQDELLRKIGEESKDPDDKRLVDLRVIDSGANLTLNRLVPQRGIDGKKPDPKDEDLERRTKPFMVDGAVMTFEHELIEFSDQDTVLDDQLRAYRVNHYSSHGYANTYTTEGKIGDHDLDAFILALLAVEMRYGIFRTEKDVLRLASVLHVGGFGIGETQDLAPHQAPIEAKPFSERRREAAGVPSRSGSSSSSSSGSDFRTVATASRGFSLETGETSRGAVVAPRGGSSPISRPGIGSRTSTFRGNGRTAGGGRLRGY